ncbi:hypothetical protein PCASD_17858 [Puccinia coronata f. sp. avenae]|uniref:Uncharacterized protein n=1 Tax=Puccinia coronata f. sp. avenae TaxID=200324 RepID=A0A2N5TQD0_9BASI|nr:hypothetical protein PCASD_17858 [Puccinia coronata f. sp. avenae]
MSDDHSLDLSLPCHKPPQFHLVVSRSLPPPISRSVALPSSVCRGHQRPSRPQPLLLHPSSDCLRLLGPYQTMVYVSYDPGTKLAVVRMTLQGLSKKVIRNALGENVSRQSFDRWMKLYRETRRIFRNPEEYEQQGRVASLSVEECEFMISLVDCEPGLFLDEIRERMYDAHGMLLSVAAVHNNLVSRLAITLKKPGTVNIRKCLVAKYHYIEKMQFIPAEFLVFTDETGICDRDLLRNFGRSARGTPTNRTITKQNSPRISLLPAIVGKLLGTRFDPSNEPVP